MSVFMRLYPELICSVKPCVLTVADDCVGRGLISQDAYELIVERTDWIKKDKARCLLDNIRTTITFRPLALENFASVLLEVEDCKVVAKKLQQYMW